MGWIFGVVALSALLGQLVGIARADGGSILVAAGLTGAAHAIALGVLVAGVRRGRSRGRTDTEVAHLDRPARKARVLALWGMLLVAGLVLAAPEMGPAGIRGGMAAVLAFHLGAFAAGWTLIRAQRRTWAVLESGGGG